MSAPHSFSEAWLRQYLEHHQIPHPGQDYVLQAFRSPPARLAGAYASESMTIAFASEKMGVTIQCESWLEMRFASECEYDQTIPGYLDQPPTGDVRITDKNGTRRRTTYTPDFIVLTLNGPLVVEVKPAGFVEERLATKHPDWQGSIDDPIYAPGRERFEELGLKFIVRTSGSLSSRRTNNLSLLLMCRHSGEPLTPDLAAKLEHLMSEVSWTTISDLAKRAQLVELTPIFRLIDSGRLHVDLDNASLGEPESCLISNDPMLLATGLKFNDEQASQRWLTGSDQSVSADAVRSRSAITRTLGILERIENGEKSRTTRRYIALVREGEKLGKTAFECVFPKFHLQGNRTPRLNPTVEAFLLQYLEEKLKTDGRALNIALYVAYDGDAVLAHPGFSPVSRPTFFKYGRSLDPKEVAQAQGGRRLANAHAAPTPVDEREIKAVIPFQVGSMDHYQADIYLVVAEANGIRYTARPYVSVLVDLFTNNVLAYWVSFRDPSKVTCAVMLRRCARRHGRLPSMIIVDRGPDFRSVYFSAVCASSRVHVAMRPAGAPRHGSEAERFFGTFKTEWLSQRPGHLVNPLAARSVSRSKAPEKQAELDLEDFLREFDDYVDHQNASIGGSRMVSGALREERGLARFPFAGIPKVVDDKFIIETAVDVRQYTLDSARGFHIGFGHFWHPALKALGARRVKPDVRKDPEDPYRAYALIRDQWVTCLHTGENRFLTKSPTAKFAEALRMGDGASIRENAKKDGNRQRIALIREHESQQAEASAPLATSDEARQNQDKAKTASPFSGLDRSLLRPLQTNEWGKNSS